MRRFAYYKGPLASLSRRSSTPRLRRGRPRSARVVGSSRHVLRCRRHPRGEPDYYSPERADPRLRRGHRADTLMTICNVCTLNLRQANHALQNDAALLARVTRTSSRSERRRTRAGSRCFTSSGSSRPARGYELLQGAAHKGLKGLKIAPSTAVRSCAPRSCSALRIPTSPSRSSGCITACGGEPIDYPAKSSAAASRSSSS